MASLKDGIVLLKEVQAKLQEVQEKNNARKDYKEALRICLMLAGVRHCIRALKKLQDSKIEVMPELPGEHRPVKVHRPMPDTALPGTCDEDLSGASALHAMLDPHHSNS